MKKILLVEDYSDITELVNELLSSEYELVNVTNLKQAKNIIESQPFDLFLLDLGLPDGSGLELVTFIRNRMNFKSVPILIMSGKAEPSAKIASLDLGADDYIEKPFDIGEFCARIRSKLRRSQVNSLPNSIRKKGEFVIDEKRIKIFVTAQQGKIDLQLSPLEFKIFSYFLNNPEQVFTRDHLITLCSGASYSVSDRSIDSHIYTLRKKMGSCESKIKTIYGVGYQFENMSKDQ